MSNFQIASSSQTWNVRLTEPVVFSTWFDEKIEVVSFRVTNYPEDDEDAAYTEITPHGFTLTKKGQRPKGKSAGYVSIAHCEGYTELRDALLDHIEAESGVTLVR